MTAARPSQVLYPTVLDRLTGGERGSAPTGDLRVGVRELTESVRRNLEWILNSRKFLGSDLGEREESERSILAYGLPDLSSFSSSRDADRKRMGTLIEEAIKTFEPRLLPRSVKVVFVPSEEIDAFQMRFTIEAILHVDPIEERVSFDTSVKSDSGAILVEAAD